MKIVLAYSGGLDTSVIIPWLKENYGNPEIIAACVNVGLTEHETAGLEEKALKQGASKLYCENVCDELITDYIFPMVKADCVYEDKYLLGTSIARPLIAKKLVEIAEKEGADAICHGATGKGNDQIRFELTIKALAPHLQIIAAWRDDKWTLQSREDEIQYLIDRGLEVPMKKEDSYSRDSNIWHISHEGLDLEDPANEPQYLKDGFLELGVAPEKAPDEPTYITLHFEKGEPVALDGEKLSPLALVEKLNELGGKNGIGLLDIVENRLVGMKSRGVYETPGGTIIYKAHELLEMITLDRDTAHYKKLVAEKYGELVYNGMWFSPLREALDAFVNKTQETVTGDVKLKLYKGNVMNAGVTSPYTLYDENVASFGDDGGAYNQADSAGFINLFGLSTKVKALLDKKREAND